MRSKEFCGESLLATFGNDRSARILGELRMGRNLLATGPADDDPLGAGRT